MSQDLADEHASASRSGVRSYAERVACRIHDRELTHPHGWCRIAVGVRWAEMHRVRQSSTLGTFTYSAATDGESAVARCSSSCPAIATKA